MHTGHPTGACLIPMLEGIVIGHWSCDGKLHPQHINGTHGDVFKYNDLVDLKKQVIQLFSLDSQTVIDADATQMVSLIYDYLIKHKFVAPLMSPVSHKFVIYSQYYNFIGLFWEL